MIFDEIFYAVNKSSERLAEWQVYGPRTALDIDISHRVMTLCNMQRSSAGAAQSSAGVGCGAGSCAAAFAMCSSQAQAHTAGRNTGAMHEGNLLLVGWCAPMFWNCVKPLLVKILVHF